MQVWKNREGELPKNKYERVRGLCYKAITGRKIEVLWRLREETEEMVETEENKYSLSNMLTIEC